MDTSPPTVLLVEDYAETRAIFRLVLESGGFRVLEAASAEDGLRIAAEHRPDVILTDLVMPGMTGVDAARALRDRDETGGVPIVAVTGSAPRRFGEEELDRWFVRVLQKPVQPDELIRAVRHAYEDGQAA
ncbi:MAG: response regulator [Longimicrobiales bacterium]